MLLEELETRTVLSAVLSPQASSLSVVTQAANAVGTSTNSGFTPIQIQEAYGVSALLSAGINGKGETIAIVDAYNDPNIAADANTFSAAYGLPLFNSTGGPTLTIAQPGGTPPTSAGWTTEISLDVEWAHAIAPEANILLVEANPVNGLLASDAAELTALMAVVPYAAQHANVVSMSWGLSEFSGQTGSAYDGVFQSLSSKYPNVTFVAAAGDYNAVIWPASSPYVLAVGGTSLSVTTSGGVTSYKSETTWSDGPAEGGGGGVSMYEGKPSYQDGVLPSDNVAPDSRRLLRRQPEHRLRHLRQHQLRGIRGLV